MVNTDFDSKHFPLLGRCNHAVAGNHEYQNKLSFTFHFELAFLS